MMCPATHPSPVIVRFRVEMKMICINNLKTLVPAGVILSMIWFAGCSGSGNTSSAIPAAIPIGGSLGHGALGMSSTPTPSPTATPTPFPMEHVLTWEDDDGSTGALGISPSAARPWLDWIMADTQHAAAAKAGGEKVALYTDPNRVAPGDPMYTTDETTFAHDCSNNRITVAGSTNYLMNVYSSHLWSLWQNEVQLYDSWNAPHDVIFEDSADEIQTQKLSAQPCNFVQTDWTAQTNSMDATLTQPIFYNGLGLIPAGYASPGPSIGLNPTSSGGMSEDCYSGRTPTGFFYAPHWNATADTQIQMNAANKPFVCQANWYGDAAQSV